MKIHPESDLLTSLPSDRDSIEGSVVFSSSAFVNAGIDAGPGGGLGMSAGENGVDGGDEVVVGIVLIIAREG